MSKPKKNDDEKLIHDTEVLLQKYRQVKWALDVAANKEMRELKHETGITEEYLHAAVFAGADISNTRLERRAQSMERSRQMLALVNESVELMRQFHPMGELYYEIISRYYLSKQQKSQPQVLEEMEQQEIYLCENTFRKYKKAAIKVIGEILWGYEDRESVGILKQFAAKNYGEE